MANTPPQYRPNGFTLVELVVVILILGILAGIAAPKFFQVASESEAAAVLTNVRTIFDAVEMFAAEHGRLPADATTGEMPTDLEGYLPPSLFTKNGPYDGFYDWNGPGTPASNYGVSILATGGSIPELRASYQAMEQMADDGDKDSGWITVVGMRVLFELAPKAVTTAPVDVGG